MRNILSKSAFIILSIIQFNAMPLISQANTEPENPTKITTKEIIEYLKGDFYFGAGLNRGGVYWSYYHRELDYGNGFHVFTGLYTPITDKLYFNAELRFSQRRFGHTPEINGTTERFDFKKSFIELPVYLSADLPEFSRIDFRFNLGAMFAYRLTGSAASEYPNEFIVDNYYYDPAQFNRFDGGLYFGVSFEYFKFFGRVGAYSGFNKLMNADIGMLNSFHIDFGFFPFRQ